MIEGMDDKSNRVTVDNDADDTMNDVKYGMEEGMEALEDVYFN